MIMISMLPETYFGARHFHRYSVSEVLLQCAILCIRFSYGGKWLFEVHNVIGFTKERTKLSKSILWRTQTIGPVTTQNDQVLGL